MKRIIPYICALLGTFACQRMELEIPSADSAVHCRISPSCVVQSEMTPSGPGTPMTRALVGKETTQALRANFIKVEEIMPDWTLASE